tara:strand:- start:112239 stop:112667 length:429 start_codon:yes stop_codon:yes gene_type:complete
MRNILLQVKIDSIANEAIANTDSSFMSIWLWIALVELAIIIVLILKLKKKQKFLKFGDLSKNKMQHIKKSTINMDNLMNSINKSKDLYKELSRSCHPDLFVNTNKQVLAAEIFQEISKHKRDFQKLMELKEKAITELNIKFK